MRGRRAARAATAAVLLSGAEPSLAGRRHNAGALCLAERGEALPARRLPLRGAPFFSCLAASAGNGNGHVR